ncbi:MAG: disulfide bond formation protein B [Proteobacteria bacterium]|nr:disulfide bond formation protein B [Pseudomonadota bacterium]
MMLSELKVKSAKPKDKIYRLFDDHGLYLEINPNGGKYWCFKYLIEGRERRMAFGVYPDISLADARSRREAARKLVANGADPAELKQAEKLSRGTRTHFLLLIAFSATLIASGLIMEYGFGILPCKMCWWQRYAHMVICAASILGFLTYQSPSHQVTRPSGHPVTRPSGHPVTRLSATTILLASLTGLAIALWQYAAQHGWLPFPASCVSEGLALEANATNLLAAMSQTKVIPCDKETFRLFGLSLAGWNIPAMLLTTALSTQILATPLKK